jgi:hypothetical protein
MIRKRIVVTFISVPHEYLCRLMIFEDINLGARKVRMNQREQNKRVKKISSALSELQQPEIPGLRPLWQWALLDFGCLDRLRTSTWPR